MTTELASSQHLSSFLVCSSSDPALVETLQDILHDDAISTVAISNDNNYRVDALKQKKATTLIKQSQAFRFQAVVDDLTKSTGSSTCVPSLTSLICDRPQSQPRTRRRPNRQRSNSSIAGLMDASVTSTTFTRALGIINEKEHQEIQKDDKEGLHVDNNTSTCDYVVPLAPPAVSSCPKKTPPLRSKKSSTKTAQFRWDRDICKIEHRLASMDQLLERALEEDLLESVDNMP